MQPRFYNTLTQRVEPFAPLDPPTVSMYNCGPTVYDFAHIGNFRAFVFADVLRRSLELLGYDVQQVMNLTDVGHMTEDDFADGAGADKMELAVQRAREGGAEGQAALADPSDPYQVAGYYIDAYLDDARAVRMRVADESPDRTPRATEHIEAMQRLIQQLLDRGHAYVAEDNAVYYAVETDPEYGRLSGNTLDKLKGGAGGRVHEQHQAVKRHPADFLLWKPDQKHLMKWPSPWGEGYPGWHLECSAMARECLGREEIDIHTGGEDNIFPHHECEIAQSRGATGRDRFAQLWMHTRFLFVEGKKMSKSEGNFYTVRGLREEGVDPVAVRWELMRVHYRTNMNFTKKGLEDAGRAVRRLRDAAEEAERESGGVAAEVSLEHSALQAFAECLADDLNTAGAIGALFHWLHENEDPADVRLGVLRQADTVLDVLEAPEERAARQDAEQKCRAIDAARAQKDYATADRLRDELKEAGYEVRSTPQGTVAKPKLA